MNLDFLKFKDINPTTPVASNTFQEERIEIERRTKVLRNLILIGLFFVFIIQVELIIFIIFRAH